MTDHANSKWQEEWRARSKSVLEAETDNFVELFLKAGLDPAKHARFAVWSGVDFSECDLAGFDFTGAQLSGCNFQRAKILETLVFHPERNAQGIPISATLQRPTNFCKAELGRVLHDPSRKPTLPALTTEIANVSAAQDWEDFCLGWQRPEYMPSDAHLSDGAIFQDCPFGPQLVVCPSGHFMMGPEDKPQREITIAYRLAVGRFAVTFAEYDFYCKMTGKELPPDKTWGRGRHPVINVSWDDATTYAKWLSERTGQPYRLLSESEWEYCCRAGTKTRYSSYDYREALGAYAWFRGNSYNKTHPVGQKLCNAFGLHDMHGNVWEWCADAWHENLDGIPSDGRPMEEGTDPKCLVMRGGSWYHESFYVDSTARYRNLPGFGSNDIGFRLARTLNP